MPLKEFFDFRFKKGRDFTYCVYRALGFKWEVEQVVCVLAVTHSCCWPRAGEEGTELGGSFKASPLSCPDAAAIHSGAEQGRVLPPLRRD